MMSAFYYGNRIAMLTIMIECRGMAKRSDEKVWLLVFEGVDQLKCIYGMIMDGTDT